MGERDRASAQEDKVNNKIKESKKERKKCEEDKQEDVDAMEIRKCDVLPHSFIAGRRRVTGHRMHAYTCQKFTKALKT